MAILEAADIMKILPHRYPFLLVDRIIECDGKERIVGIKNLTINEPFFQGHFPGQPIMPGVLQLEAMAQVGGILINQLLERKVQISYFTAIDNARFRIQLVPGDQLRMTAQLVRMRTTMCKCHAEISVDGKVACEADMMFVLPRPDGRTAEA